MFNRNFYPTPPELAARMIEAAGDLSGKKVLEPSAGAGNLVIALQNAGAAVVACEKEDRLQAIVQTLCPVISPDFFDVRSEDVVGVKAIVMNPPFDSASSHISHAWKIAPEGCVIVALCNASLMENKWSRDRKALACVVEDYGYWESLGQAFKEAERVTDVEIALVFLQKPASNYETEFEGFFLDDEPEEQEDGVIQYDVIRDTVNRYVAAVKLYDSQLTVGKEMHRLVGIFPEYVDKSYREEINVFMVPGDDKVEQYRAEFKKKLQRRAWQFIFDKLDMRQHMTRALREDLAKFVEYQANVPFTMRNVYKMLEIVVGTTSSRMDKALETVFDELTRHYKENRYHVEGWATNSHYLVNRRFILNFMCEPGFRGEICFRFYNNGELMEDVQKAMCYMTGTKFSGLKSLSDLVRENNTAWGDWIDWHFFRVRCYKKGTMHFEFKDVKHWEEFNYNVARIKGFPLPESKGKKAA